MQKKKGVNVSSYFTSFKSYKKESVMPKNNSFDIPFIKQDYSITSR